jgi:SAM-dependent methyltransferase
MVAKAVVGWMAYLARDPEAARHGLGYHWRGMFERIARGGGLDDATLCAVSQRYAEEPGEAAAAPPALVRADHPLAGTRTLSTGRPLDAVVAIARSWERLLAPPAPLLRLDRPAALGRSADAAGAFDAAWHWDNLFLDTPPFRFIAERLRPASVFDIGCGNGAYLRLLERFGAGTVFGIDALPLEATVLGAGQYATVDVSAPFDLGRRFDLVICVEVAEHLDPAREAVLIETIARHADRAIVFSAAEPGQPGHGHINCRPLAYWLDLWRARGWLPDAAESMAMRGLASLSWFRRNLVVLHRAETIPDRCGAAALLDVARRRYAWYGQAPGIRDAAFEEVPPAEGGYADG